MPEMDVRGDRLHEETADGLSGEISIETPEADAAEQRQPVRENTSEWPRDLSPEIDPADAYEQRRTVHEDDSSWPDDISVETDPADAYEQRIIVEIDEDDYR
ncbi:hypothetical protein [Streptosporangium becharense]|uniref:hypothetical protein n=1 Tax=Streptosporangium becharense TaxID=1816182 RepID=UPI001FE4C663|nr:hypothetical protein [Streptosporangium becharense]